MKVLLDGDDSTLPTFEPILTKLDRLFQRLSPDEIREKEAFKRHRASKGAKSRRNHHKRLIEGMLPA